MKKQNLYVFAWGLMLLALCLSITGCASETVRPQEQAPTSVSEAEQAPVAEQSEEDLEETQPVADSTETSNSSESSAASEADQSSMEEPSEEIPEEAQSSLLFPLNPSTPDIAPLDPSEPVPDADDILPIITKEAAVTAADAYWSQPGKYPEVPEGNDCLVGLIQEPSTDDCRYHMGLFLYSEEDGQRELIDEVWLDGVTGEVVQEA